MKPSICAPKVDLTMKNGLTVLTLPPPPPPPQLPTPKKGRKMMPVLIAVVLIAIILVATVVLFSFNVIKWPFNAKDTTAPIVSINSPTNTTYTTFSITANATVTDPDSGVQTVLCEVDGIRNATLILQTGTSFYYNDMISITSDGSHRIRIYANDTAGNTNQSQTQFFTVNTTQPTNYGVVNGKVTDKSNYPVSNVKVSVGGQSSVTNDQGYFSISNVTAEDNALLTFSKNGSATTYKVTDVQVGNASFVETTISNVGNTGSISAASGGTVTTSDGGSVEIDANSIVDSQNNTYTGTAAVSVTTFDPSDENQLNAFPGEYQGISAQNETVPLKSYGFMDITVADQNGQELQLAQGRTATISIPVPYSMQTEAQNLTTCPLWYFNPRTGTWHEQGQGTYNPSLGCFVGNVSHFSTWNYDIRYPAGYVSGRVIDSNGNPVQGANVRCWGIGWYQQRWASGETSTDYNGTFRRIPVEVGVVFKYQASKGGHKSAINETGPLAKNQEYDVGDIVLDAPVAQFTLTWGANPRDLDSHLAARLSDNTTFHVYYGSRGDLASPPFANLDTDMRYGFGPEVVSITRLRPGTYRYSVRHYTGDGTIETSGVEVNMIISNVGIYRFTPPSGQPAGTDIWRVVDIVIDSPGHVAAINPINDYVTGGDESELLFP